MNEGKVSDFGAAKRLKLAQVHKKALTELIEHMNVPFAEMQIDVLVKGERLKVTLTVERSDQPHE